MTTTISSPDRFGSFLRGLLQKNRSTMIYLFVLSFFCLPLQYLLVMFRRINVDGVTSTLAEGSTLNGFYLTFSAVMMVIIWMVATLVVGISGTNFMQNRRAVDLYHSLPLTRRQLLLASFTARFVTVALPITVNYIITGILAAIRGALAPLQNPFTVGAALLDLLGWYITVFGILAVIMLMATQVGSTFDTFLFSGVFLAAPPILYGMHLLLCQTMLLGFQYEIHGGVLSCLSPATLMPGRYLCGASTSSPLFNGAMAGWLVVSVLVLLFAMRQYTKRPSERAESPAKGGVAALVFRLLAIFVGGILLGILFCTMVGITQQQTGLVLLFVALFGCLVFLLVEAILNRGFRGIVHRSYVEGGVLILLTVFYMGILSTGGMGFESFVPSVDTVYTAEINYRGRFEYASHYNAKDYSIEQYKLDSGIPQISYDYSTIKTVTLKEKDSVALITDLHRAAKAKAVPNYEYSRGDEAGGNLVITYHMKNGRKLVRSYYCSYTDDVRNALLALEDSDEFRRESNPLSDWTAENNEVDSVSICGANGLSAVTLTEKDKLLELISALRADVLAESTADYCAPDRKTVAYLYLDSHWTDKWSQTIATENFWSSYTVPISDRYENTLALLGEWGILPAVQAEDWDGGRLYVWGCEVMGSGMTIVPNWYGETQTPVEGYDYCPVTREQAEKLLSLATYNHVNNGKDDSLYLCVMKDGSAGLPMFLSKEAAKSLGDPAVNAFLNEYYGWKSDTVTTDKVDTEQVAAEPMLVE